MDERRYTVLGGQTEQITEALETQYADGHGLGDALKLGARVLGPTARRSPPTQLEVALLERAAPTARFRRLKDEELTGLPGLTAPRGVSR